MLTKESRISLHDITAKTLEGGEKNLGDYKDHVLLVVNTASECGSTPQYAGLEALWREYKDKGFVLLGFPSNDFGGQEPGSEAQIREFCSKNYDVTFPLFSKVKTVGDGQSPVYRYLAADHGEPKWNFHKYLVSKKGRVIKAFPTSVAPDDPKLRAAIDAALAT